MVDERRKEQRLLEVSSPIVLPPRRCPTAREYFEAWITQEPKWPSSAVGGAYTRFTMPEYKQRPDAMSLQAWHGAPIAAILHAFRAVLGNLTPPEFVEPSVRKQLRSLQELYERRPGGSPEDGPSNEAGARPLPNPRASAPALGSSTPSLPQTPPPQSSYSARDALADQVKMHVHNAQAQSKTSAQAVSPTFLDQNLVATEALREQSSGKRCRYSSVSLPQHQPRRSPPSPTPALTRKASTESQHASPNLQLHRPKTHHEGGEKEVNETTTDPFSHVFRYHWKWGPQSSTQEKVERFLGLSHDDTTNIGT